MYLPLRFSLLLIRSDKWVNFCSASPLEMLGTNAILCVLCIWDSKNGWKGKFPEQLGWVMHEEYNFFSSSSCAYLGGWCNSDASRNLRCKYTFYRLHMKQKRSKWDLGARAEWLLMFYLDPSPWMMRQEVDRGCNTRLDGIPQQKIQLIRVDFLIHQ